MKRKRMGVALGAGAARGFSHLGVLQVMEEEGIPVDYLSGCSIGALIGALYCSGMTVDEIARLAEKIDPWRWIDLTLPKMGLVIGKKIEDIVRDYTDNRTFDELEKPLSIVATDICTGERVVIDEGYVCEAVRASIAIPGIFIPVQRGNEFLVDGGIVDPVPVDAVKRMGADVIVGVNLGPHIEPKKIKNIYDVILQGIDIMQNEIVRLRGVEADFLISPDLKGINPAAFDQVRECMAAGRKSALEAARDIKRAVTPANRMEWLQNLVRHKRSSDWNRP